MLVDAAVVVVSACIGAMPTGLAVRWLPIIASTGFSHFTINFLLVEARSAVDYFASV
mgnify:CR=1 FL=1